MANSPDRCHSPEITTPHTLVIIAVPQVQYGITPATAGQAWPLCSATCLRPAALDFQFVKWLRGRSCVCPVQVKLCLANVAGASHLASAPVLKGPASCTGKHQHKRGNVQTQSNQNPEETKAYLLKIEKEEKWRENSNSPYTPFVCSQRIRQARNHCSTHCSVWLYGCRKGPLLWACDLARWPTWKFVICLHRSESDSYLYSSFLFRLWVLKVAQGQLDPSHPCPVDTGQAAVQLMGKRLAMIKLWTESHGMFMFIFLLYPCFSAWIAIQDGNVLWPSPSTSVHVCLELLKFAWRDVRCHLETCWVSESVL